jgi:hypothetical protein
MSAWSRTGISDRNGSMGGGFQYHRASHVFSKPAMAPGRLSFVFGMRIDLHTAEATGQIFFKRPTISIKIENCLQRRGAGLEESLGPNFVVTCRDRPPNRS